MLSEAAERWGLRLGLSCLAASPALTPRKGWARPGGSPRSCAPPGPHPGLPSLSQLVEKPLPGDMGATGGAACKPNLEVRLRCVTLGRPLVSSDAQISPLSDGVVARAKVDNNVQMRGRVVGSNLNSKRHSDSIYSVPGLLPGAQHALARLSLRTSLRGKDCRPPRFAEEDAGAQRGKGHAGRCGSWGLSPGLAPHHGALSPPVTHHEDRALPGLLATGNWGWEQRPFPLLAWLVRALATPIRT